MCVQHYHYNILLSSRGKAFVLTGYGAHLPSNLVDTGLTESECKAKNSPSSSPDVKNTSYFTGISPRLHDTVLKHRNNFSFLLNSLLPLYSILFTLQYQYLYCNLPQHTILNAIKVSVIKFIMLNDLVTV
jgi:hypothetical protein